MNRCLYPSCAAKPRCRAQYESEYIYHSSYNDECDGSGEHKWICDEHWKLLEFLKEVIVLESSLKL